MGFAYSAYGMEIRSAFELPGMQPRRAPKLPGLKVELVAGETLRGRWSGLPEGRAPWRGRLGDGSELTIARGRGGDLLIANGARAEFLLDRGPGTLLCAPAERRDPTWIRVLASRVLPNAALARGYQALHASAVEGRDGVVAFAAPSGTGKSTLAAELLGRGWPHFTDDVLVLASGAEGVCAHPGTPHTTLPYGGSDLRLLGEVLDMRDEEAWVAVGAAALEPRPLAAILLYERREGLALGARRLAPSPLLLASCMLGLPNEQGGEGARFSLYSELAEVAPVIKLTAGPGDSPTAIADLVEGALAPCSSALTEGLVA